MSFIGLGNLEPARGGGGFDGGPCPKSVWKVAGLSRDENFLDGSEPTSAARP